MTWLKKLTSRVTKSVAAPFSGTITEKLKGGLQKTSSKITESLRQTFQSKRIDTETLESLEDLLIMSDFGVGMSSDIIDKLRKEKLQFPDDVAADITVKTFLKAELARYLEGAEAPLTFEGTPHIVLMVGVNGTGKTTTIGKLAHQLMGEGRSVALAACDTFRTAAVAQLDVWAKRSGARFYSGESLADPASVAFDAVTRAKADGVDVLFIDTAGRLQNKDNLMAELEKIHRVINKACPGAPQQTLLVLDATVGQNARLQVQAFQKSAPLTGLIITKLDGTAKGGMVVPLYHQFKLPIHAIGVGEAIDDLMPFESAAYLDALLGLKNPT